MEISKRDWKLFRERIVQWQEAYMERLCDEYHAILNRDQLASDRFWALEQRIRQDRRSLGVVLQMRKSEMIWQLAGLVSNGIITMEELNGFSDDVIHAVARITQSCQDG